MIKKYLLIMAILLVGIQANAFKFMPSPNPVKAGGTGCALAIEKGRGTYNYEIYIYDAVGNEVLYHKGENYVINNPDQQHIVHIWDLRNKHGRFVATGDYVCDIYLKNTKTGKTRKKRKTIGVKSYSGNEKWLSDAGAELIHGQHDDKVYRFKHQGASKDKAIICLKGWDPHNRSDGVRECFKNYFFIIGPNCEVARGWDIYNVVWKDAGASLHVNVQRATDIIRMIDDTYGHYSEIVVLGFSMGGIIGRYALAKSETDENPLPVTKFISIEGEHQGAHINLTFQAALFHLVKSGNFGFELGKFLHSPGVIKAEEYLYELYAPSSKEMLYYHNGLVENYVKSAIEDECPFKTSQLNEIRAKADSWHDEFYREISKYGNCNGGYPSFCKNYSISLSSRDVRYHDKNQNEYMGVIKGPFGLQYRIYSDKEDLDPASHIDLSANDSYQSKKGYNEILNFVRIESVFDLQDISYAKKKGVISTALSNEELERKSRFDKIYLRPDGLRLDHQAAYDDLIIDQIREILNDTQPKGRCKIFNSDRKAMNGISNLLIID